MESCSNQKSVKQIKICFIFFKVATLCLEDSFSHSWHSLNQLHLECFSNSLERVPTYDEHLLDAFPSLCGPTHPKPSQLGWARVIVEARSSDAALHSSHSWLNSPYTAVRCDGKGVLCLWHCLIYLEFKAHLTSMATTALCSLHLLGLSFVFQQDNDPTHLQAV